MILERYGCAAILGRTRYIATGRLKFTSLFSCQPINAFEGSFDMSAVGRAGALHFCYTWEDIWFDQVLIYIRILPNTNRGHVKRQEKEMRYAQRLLTCSQDRRF